MVITAAAAACLVSTLLLLVVLLVSEGWSTLSWEFLSSPPREGMTQGGVFPAIVGTTLVVLITTAAAVPAGAATAVYLSEYSVLAPRFGRTARRVVSTLAGIPSVVFGLFGLAFFVQFVGAGIDSVTGATLPRWGHPGLLWAGLTMGVMTLPVVIVAVEEALHAVPQELREASAALGATRFQTVRTAVLPHALPGVLTGAILAMGRAAGEVAPLLFTGAAYYVPASVPGLADQFMALGYHLYVMATQSIDVEGTRGMQGATALVLLGLTAGLGGIAAVLRSRLQRGRTG